jgi:hypothetical protein
MNPRIKQIAEQAGFYSSEYNNAEDTFEIFAQLIARECIAISQKYDFPRLDGPGTIISNRIAEHFGVKE